MNPLKAITDSYERKARLYPLLLCVAPIAAIAFGNLPSNLSIFEKMFTLFMATGGTYLLSQISRDSGKQGEAQLFERWGGMPSVSLLRHADQRIDPITKERYHKILSSCVPGTQPIALDEERADPTSADKTYTAWSNFLRVNARSSNQFPLLAYENSNYGYRRNVWGMRPYGLAISAAAAVVAAIELLSILLQNERLSSEFFGLSFFAFLFLLLWSFLFTESWVRLAAEAYATRLLETTDSFAATSSMNKSEIINRK